MREEEGRREGRDRRKEGKDGREEGEEEKDKGGGNRRRGRAGERRGERRWKGRRVGTDMQYMMIQKNLSKLVHIFFL